jgi:hypothetical protein
MKTAMTENLILEIKAKMEIKEIENMPVKTMAEKELMEIECIGICIRMERRLH